MIKQYIEKYINFPLTTNFLNHFNVIIETIKDEINPKIYGSNNSVLLIFIISFIPSNVVPNPIGINNINEYLSEFSFLIFLFKAAIKVDPLLLIPGISVIT